MLIRQFSETNYSPETDRLQKTLLPCGWGKKEMKSKSVLSLSLKATTVIVLETFKFIKVKIVNKQRIIMNIFYHNTNLPNNNLFFSLDLAEHCSVLTDRYIAPATALWPTSILYDVIPFMTPQH